MHAAAANSQGTRGHNPALLQDSRISARGALAKPLKLLAGDAPESAMERQDETEYRHSVHECESRLEAALSHALAAWRRGDRATAVQALATAMELVRR